MKKRSIFAALAAIAVTATAAYAIVTYTPENGGFAGKGDVQTAFGWNNAAMQQNHLAITFEYDASATWVFDCEWYTGPDHNRSHHQNTKEQTFGVPAALAVGSNSRQTGQYTGWFLDAIGSIGAIGAPVDSDCGAEGNEMKSIVPGTAELINSGGGLYAVFGAERRLLTITP